MPSDQKWELASRKCFNCGVIRRERQVNEPTAFKLGACDKQHEKHFCACHPSRVIVLHSQLRRAACQRIVEDQAHTCIFVSFAQPCRHCDAHLSPSSLLPFPPLPSFPPSSPPPQQHLHSGKVVTGSGSVRRDRATKPWKVDDMQRRRRVRHQLIQAALWAPTMREDDACQEALVEQQDWEESAQVRWPETHGLVVQNGAVGPRSG